MKRTKTVVTGLILLLVIIACDIGPISIDLGGGGGGSQPQAGPVEAGIDSLKSISIGYLETNIR